MQHLPLQDMDPAPDPSAAPDADIDPTEALMYLVAGVCILALYLGLWSIAGWTFWGAVIAFVLLVFVLIPLSPALGAGAALVAVGIMATFSLVLWLLRTLDGILKRRQANRAGHP